MVDWFKVIKIDASYILIILFIGIERKFILIIDYVYQVNPLIRVIIFGLVWFLLKKKVTKSNLKKTKTGSNRPVSARFDFLGQKPFWLNFFSLT